MCVTPFALRAKIHDDIHAVEPMHAVRGEYDEATFHDFEHCLLELELRLNVEMGCRLVKDENASRWIEECTRERDTVAFSSR